jgi:hypothetical protein
MYSARLVEFLLLAGHYGLTAAQSNHPNTPMVRNVFEVTGNHTVRIDTGQYGPLLEEYHYFYDQWPIGLAVSKSGRVFTCYTRGAYAVSALMSVLKPPRHIVIQDSRLVH